MSRIWSYIVFPEFNRYMTTYNIYSPAFHSIQFRFRVIIVPHCVTHPYTVWIIRKFDFVHASKYNCLIEDVFEQQKIMQRLAKFSGLNTAELMEQLRA